MPIYEFECRSCGERFEAYCSLSGNREDVACPKCGKKDLQQLVSTFSAPKASPIPAAGKSCRRRS